MSGDALGFIGVAITAVVGGSGIAGVLSGAVELSQRNRLRKRGEKTVSLAKLLPVRSPERTALEHAVAIDAAKLSALSVIQLALRVRLWILATVVVFVLVLAGLVISALSSPILFHAMAGWSASTGLPPLQRSSFFAGVLIGVTGALFLLQSALLALRRDAYVEAVLAGDTSRQALEKAMAVPRIRRR